MSRTFEPIPWQVAPWKDTSPTLVISSAAGTGKSWMALHKVNAYCNRFPGALGLVTRKYAESLKNSVIPWLEQIVPNSVRHLQNKNRFEYPNGSAIVYGGMKDEKQREKIRSITNKTSGVDIALMEEANGHVWDDFEEISGRMRGKAAPWQQIMLITNPGPTSHWIYQKLILPVQAGKLSGVSVYRPTCEDNPTLTPEYLARLNGLTGVRLKRMRFGQWCNAEGTVFEDSWDADKHIVDPFPIPKEWRRIRCIDLGFVNPRVCLWIAIDPDGGMWVYRQLYQTRQRATDFAREIKRRSAGENIEATICDHDAGERADLESEGIITIAATKDVSRGIQAVEQRLLGVGNGPRLHFLRGSLVSQDDELRKAFLPCSTEEEFDVYVWARNPDGSLNKEEPKKKDDHGMDALRYGVMYEDKDALDPADADPEILRHHVQRAQRELSTERHSPGPSRGGAWTQRGGSYGLR